MQRRVSAAAHKQVHGTGAPPVSRVRRKVRKVVGRKRALDGTGVHIDSAVQDEYEAVDGSQARRSLAERRPNAPLHPRQGKR